MNLGIVLADLNETEKAESSYLQALKHRPKYPDCYYNLGNLVNIKFALNEINLIIILGFFQVHFSYMFQLWNI